MISLGTYGVENYNSYVDPVTKMTTYNTHKWLCWSLMMSAQFITYITMAQLLIAIINQTFARVEDMQIPFMY